MGRLPHRTTASADFPTVNPYQSAPYEHLQPLRAPQPPPPDKSFVAWFDVFKLALLDIHWRHRTSIIGLAVAPDSKDRMWVTGRHGFSRFSTIIPCKSTAACRICSWWALIRLNRGRPRSLLFDVSGRHPAGTSDMILLCAGWHAVGGGQHVFGGHQYNWAVLSMFVSGWRRRLRGPRESGA